jgi:hypothetical protein
MQDWMISHQYLDNVSDPRFLGGFGPNTPTTSTRAITEAVADAYLLAKKINDQERTKLYNL